MWVQLLWHTHAADSTLYLRHQCPLRLEVNLCWNEAREGGNQSISNWFQLNLDFFGMISPRDGAIIYLSLSFSLHVYYFIFLCFVPLLLFDSYQFSIIVFSQSLNFDWLRLNFCLIFFSNLNHYLCLNLSWVLLHLHSSTHPFILINIFSLSHSNASISPHFTFFCVTKSCLFLHVSLNKSIKHFITYLLIRTRMSTLCLGTNPFALFT